MATLKLTPFVAGQRSTDLDRTNNRSTLISGDEEIAQRLRITLQEQLGSYRHRRNGGTPWLEFRESGDNAIRAMVAATVRGVTGVRDVPECAAESEIVDGQRVVRVRGLAESESGSLLPFGLGVPV